jgi:hypothetical protein
MTEEQWQTASEPHAMLEFLQSSGRTSQRKHRLFAVACSRRIWGWIDALGRTAVDAAENFADGLTGPEELRATRLACQGAGGQAAWYAAATNPTIAARNAARSAQAGAAIRGAEAEEILAQTALLREIFGNPFRPVTINPPWLTLKVKTLAQCIYDDRAFDHLTSLAATLEEAGCNDTEILEHCRVPGSHVRGCWVVDLVLGKEH